MSRWLHDVSGLTAGYKYQIHSESANDTPISVSPAQGGISTNTLTARADGHLPRFVYTSATVYVKRLTYLGALSGDVATSTSTWDLDAVLGGARVEKTGDTSRNSTTVRTADPDLALAVVPGNINLTGAIFYDGIDAGDLKIGIDGPAGTTGYIEIEALASGATGATSSTNHGAMQVNSGTVACGCVSGTVMFAKFRAALTVVTAGTISVGWAQNTSNGSNVTVKAGSWMEWKSR